MKLFKKVLFTLFPKILFVQIICHALLLFIAVKAIPVNSELHSFYNKGHIFIILLVAILGTLIFAPKVFKIVFMEPNKGQRITRIALLFFIFMTIASPNLFLDRLATFHFGKTKSIQDLSEIFDYPEYSFFIIKNPDNLDISMNAYYIHDHISGRHRNTLNIDIYASRLMNVHDQSIIIGKQYNTDYHYEGRASASYIQSMIDKDFEIAKRDFDQLKLSSHDTLVRTFESFSREKYIAAAQLINKNIDNNTIIVETETYNITNMKKKSLVIYLGFFVVIELFLILFLATGKYFKEKIYDI